MAAKATAADQRTTTDRPVYGLVKHRSSDLAVGDVIRNRFGKWDVVSSVVVDEDGRYVSVQFEVGGEWRFRSVHLVDVQVVKPS